MISADDIEAMTSYNDLDNFQSECKKTAIYPRDPALLYVTLGLTNESGEFAGKVKKMIRDGSLDDKAAAYELFDVMWYAAMCAEELGYDLSEIASMGLEKLRSRQQRGVLGGSGDNR